MLDDHRNAVRAGRVVPHKFGERQLVHDRLPEVPVVGELLAVAVEEFLTEIHGGEVVREFTEKPFSRAPAP